MSRHSSRDPETDPAATLGRQLRRLRLAAGFSTQETLAARLGYGQDVVSKAETGAQPPTGEVFALWLEACQASDELREILTDLHTLARKAHGPIPQFIEKWFAAEGEAEFLRLWALWIFPGVLQVKEYALAMYDLPGIDKDEAAATVAVRLKRQSILDGPDPVQVIAILDESVLYRRIGSPQVMAKQLTHLLEVSERPNVTIQVARGTGAYWGLVGEFQIASGDGMPDTLLMPGVEDQTMEDRRLSRKALILFEKLRGHALNVGESRAVLMEARDHWNSQQ